MLLFMCPTLNIAKVISEYLMWRNTTTNHISKALDYFLSNQHVLTLLSRQLADKKPALPFLSLQITQEQSPTESLCARTDSGPTDSQFVTMDGRDTAHS